MFARSPSQLREAFALERHRYIYLIGGGGKTSLMFTLAHVLETAGRSVLTTTSTKIRYPKPGESSRVIVAPLEAGLIDCLRTEFADRRHLTASPSLLQEERKLRGFTSGELDTLADAHVADYLLVEADGAAGRSLKAHLDYEPVLSDRADLVIVVIGVDCVGRPMNDLQVHRAALLGERLGRPFGSLITAHDVAAIVFHREGYLRRVGRDSEIAVFLSKAGTPAAEREAQGLAEELQRRDQEHRISAIVIGDVGSVGVFSNGRETPGPEERKRKQDGPCAD
jgi:probable selenium-dependent hydroxylase accessory protein YqeC